MKIPSMNPSARIRGFTLLELSVVLALFVIILLAIWGLFHKASDAIHHNIKVGGMDNTVRRLVERLSEELKETGDDSGVNHVPSHPPNVTTSSSSLTFQRRVAFDGLPSDWTTPIAYGLEPSMGETPGNGIDDDLDGVIDEQRVARIQGGISVPIADGITDLRFTRGVNQYSMDIQVMASVVLRPGEAPVNRVLSTTVAFRNKP